MTTTQNLLESSFELNLNNYGPEDVERLNDWAINAYRALEALQAEVARLETLAKGQHVEMYNARLRLAEIEKQEPVIYQAKTKPGFLSTSAYAWEDCEKADFLVYEADGVHVRGLYAAAGASLVATPIVAWAKSTPRKLRITTMDMGREDGWRPLGYTAAGASPVEPSQEWKPALQAEVERLTTLARGQHIELYNARLQLAAAQGQLVIPSDVREMAEKIQKNVYRAPLSWAAKVIDFVADYAAPIPQPPAPGEAAREYMTGYSDAKEWAKPSQALDLSDDEIEDIAGYYEFPSILFARAIIAAINAKEQPNG